MIEYILGQAAVAVFAITGVLGAIRKDRDILGLVVLGVITAIGGGTLRDTILNTSVFWVQDFNYILVSIIASVLIFFLLKISKINEARYRMLLYFDALGVAYFCIQAFEKTINLGYSYPVALIMAMITGMGGGVMRDVLTGRPNLLITKELYASPALLGILLYILLKLNLPDSHIPSITAISFIFLFRSLAVYFHLQMPSWLVNKRENDQ
ncbi:trimeric intracellular cation channel family protein [Oceanispirochaeta crateris]|jgi:uncharacterized membrane protein YeiH|uniref:Trimeric intracellular cation channel family protein n=1 Tax=Oceanispirochaeta crateris TaxID=2518645 RepID=A0A5C1QKA1_9SPIO|nr:trimeric intracellular cation channel family protein [Oceanispirochaeta crateris]QEN07619.1 trimeric intracellular cation channel family protein [Oceanispirochaeta crateris]